MNMQMDIVVTVPPYTIAVCVEKVSTVKVQSCLTGWDVVGREVRAGSDRPGINLLGMLSDRQATSA